jgi:phage tail protein X
VPRAGLQNGQRVYGTVRQSFSSMRDAIAHLRLTIDILSIKMLVWMFGENDEFLDSHLFFFDRYSELADLHRRHGHTFKADLLTAIAEAHYTAAPGDDDDDPQHAAAIAMPVPQPPVITNAVSTTRVH